MHHNLALLTNITAALLAFSHRRRERTGRRTVPTRGQALAIGLAAEADALVATGGIASGLLAGPAFAIAIGRVGGIVEETSNRFD